MSHYKQCTEPERRPQKRIQTQCDNSEAISRRELIHNTMLHYFRGYRVGDHLPHANLQGVSLVELEALRLDILPTDHVTPLSPPIFDHFTSIMGEEIEFDTPHMWVLEVGFVDVVIFVHGKGLAHSEVTLLLFGSGGATEHALSLDRVLVHEGRSRLPDLVVGGEHARHVRDVLNTRQ
jgi:hypothetical protein